MEVKLLTAKFLAEEIVRTGSEQYDQKINRMYVGIYDDDTNWFIPLEGNLSRRAPKSNVFDVHFDTNNPHLKRPGLNLQKAVYITDRNNLLDIRNTMPKSEYEYISDHYEELNHQFKEYVKKVVQLPLDSKQLEISTVPFYPDGIERLIGQRVDMFGLEGPVVNYDPSIKSELPLVDNVEVDQLEQSEFDEFNEFDDPYDFNHGREI